MGGVLELEPLLRANDIWTGDHIVLFTVCWRPLARLEVFVCTGQNTKSLVAIVDGPEGPRLS